jgi:hypothetical protein
MDSDDSNLCFGQFLKPADQSFSAIGWPPDDLGLPQARR